MDIDALQVRILKWRIQQQELHGVGFPLEVKLTNASYEALGKPEMLFGMWVCVRG